MEKIVIQKDQVETLFESKFIKVFDLQYEQGKHYFDATRNSENDLVAIKSTEQFKEMLPNAVTCFVILKVKAEEPKLLLFYEYRYPTGQFLLSPPAGLIDAEDKQEKDPLLSTAKREIFEETGIEVKDTDKLFVINPLAFSTPGMTDESNGLVGAVIELDDLSSLNQTHAVGSECFNGFVLLDREKAEQIWKSGKDENGIFYSIYTWSALLYFLSKVWDES